MKEAAVAVLVLVVADVLDVGIHVKEDVPQLVTIHALELVLDVKEHVHLLVQMDVMAHVKMVAIRDAQMLVLMHVILTVLVHVYIIVDTFVIITVQTLAQPTVLVEVRNKNNNISRSSLTYLFIFIHDTLGST